MPVQKENERYTYADYSTWDSSERWELIDGIAYAMAPAPGSGHQGISVKLAWQLQSSLNGKPCRLFTAPFDVRLNATDEDDTVIQPDLSVICDRSKIDEKGCRGAPDFVIEILSPSSARMDKLLKYNKYQLAGVREYWIVDPETTSVQVAVLENGRYFVTVYGEEDIAPVNVLPGCEVILKDVFAE
jgi:Uma2 family endonuclease